MTFSNRADGLAGMVEHVNSQPDRARNPNVNLPGKSFDIADALPDTARAKLVAWREQRDESQAVVRDLSEKVQTAETELREARQEHAVLSDRAAASRAGRLDRYCPEGHPLRVAAAEKIERLEAEVSRLRSRRDAAQHRRDVAWRPVKVVEDYLAENRGAEFSEFAGSLPGLRKGETHPQGVERLRKSIAEIDADLHECRSAPATATEVKAAVREQVEALAEKGEPDIAKLLERRTEQIEWPERTDRPEVFGVGTGPNGVVEVKGFSALTRPDSLAVMAWLFKPALLKALESEIDAYAGDGALSETERAEKEAKLLADRLRLERSEEAIIVQALDEGVAIERRADSDPLALLGIEVSTQKSIGGSPS